MYYIEQEKFGTYLRQLRKKRQLTQADVMEMTGINTDTLRRIEQGTSIPILETLQLLSLAYKVDLIEQLRNFMVVNSTLIQEAGAMTSTMLLQNNLEKYTHYMERYNVILEDKLTKGQYLMKEELNREKTFFEIYSLYFSSRQSNLHQTIDKILDKLSQMNFDHETPLNFDYLDIRLSFLLSNIYRRLDLMDQAHFYLEMAEHAIEHVDLNDRVKTELTLLLLMNLSYFSHRLDDHEEADKYAFEGIELSESSGDFSLLHVLLIRKGIALFLLENHSYIDFIRRALFFSYATNNLKVLTNQIATYKNQYPTIYQELQADPSTNFIIQYVMEHDNQS